jgi:hypothetical protein
VIEQGDARTFLSPTNITCALNPPFLGTVQRSGRVLRVVVFLFVGRHGWNSVGTKLKEEEENQGGLGLRHSAALSMPLSARWLTPPRQNIKLTANLCS